MSSIRRIRNAAIAVAIGSASLIGLTPQPAAASVDINNCQFGYNWSQGLVVATCYNTTQSSWHLRLTCERFIGIDHYITGTTVYGSGTSRAVCDPHIAEVVSVDIINT